MKNIWEKENFIFKEVEILFFSYNKEKSMKVKKVDSIINLPFNLIITLLYSRVLYEKNYNFCIYLLKQNTCEWYKYVKCYENESFHMCNMKWNF